MATTARQQYFADETSLSKEKREFSIADSVQQKIDSVETGAEVNVIEEVKVNGVPLVPDANKAVDIYVPGVVDNLYSLSTTDALSAKQGKVLYDYIQNIASRGRFLSNWNSDTGLPVTNPTESPYLYKAGDYYIVSNVAAVGGTNYRPDGSSYTIGQASTTVETNTVNVSDVYLYDGTNWLLLSNTGRSIAIDSSLSTTSTNPVENRVITNALNNKQDALTVGKGINIDTNDVISNTLPGPTVSATAPTNPIQGDMWYDTTDDTLKTYDGTQWNATGGGSSSNTQTFYLSSTSDLTNAQAAYDWYAAGKEPIISLYGCAYTFRAAESGRLIFAGFLSQQNSSSASYVQQDKIYLNHTSGTITSISKVGDTVGGSYLRINQNYSTPYAPQYAGSPATKKYVDDKITASPTAPSSPTEGMLWYDTTNDVLKTYDGTNWNEVSGATYTAGENIQINNGVISATDTTYNAGTNITIQDECTTESDMKGPCPKGSHIPSQSEWNTLKNIRTGLGQDGTAGDVFAAKFKIPFGNYRWGSTNATTYNAGTNGMYWSSTPSANTYKAYFVIMRSGYFATDATYSRTYGYSIRPFKNAPVVPDSSWTTILDGSSVATGAGIFYNATLGLISASSNGTAWTTIADKNVGATVVWNEGDTLSADNCGGLFQWGNNYMFPFYGTVSGTTTLVDTTGYGPGNYYYSGLFNTTYEDWASPHNDNLWGGVSQGTFQDCIHNVISAVDTTYSAGTGINIDGNNEISNTQPGPSVGSTAPQSPSEGDLWYDTTNDALKAYNGTSWETEGTKMVVLEYGVSTWQNFLDAYNKNAVVYCKVSSGSSGNRMAFMAYTAGSSTPTEVEFQYYRSRNSHSTDATQLDEVYVYKLTDAGVWSTTTRNTGAKMIAGTGIGLTFNASGATISADTTTLATKTYVDDKSTIVSATAPSSPTEGMLWYDTTNDILKVYDGTNWNNVDTDTVYYAGDNITIEDRRVTHLDIQGPCSDGWHVPTKTEMTELVNTGITISAWDTTGGRNFSTYLKIPAGGYRDASTSNVANANDMGEYAISTQLDTGFYPPIYENYHLSFRATNGLSGISVGGANGGTGRLLRPFKDTVVVPDNTWTELYATVPGNLTNGIFRNQTEGLISINCDGVTQYTISDKNLGATTVYNIGDTLSEANCGKFFQTGNNYGFNYSGTLTTSATQIDASGYGPGNYYSSDTFITASEWDSSENANLWGGQTEGTWISGHENTISATGGGVTYTAGNGISIDSNNEISNTLPGAIVSATAPSSPTEGMVWYDTTNDVLKTYDGTNWNEVGGGAGGGGVLRMANARIVNATSPDVTTIRLYLADNTINEGDMVYGVVDDGSYATGTLYEVKLYNSDGTTLLHTCEYLSNNFSPAAADGGVMGMYLKSGNNKYFVNLPCLEYKAGEGIDISDHRDYSAMQGPCSAGFHIPTKNEWNAVNTAGIAMGAWTADDGQWAIEYLFLPPVGYRDFTEGGEIYSGGTTGYYRTCTCNEGVSSDDSYCFKVEDGGFAEIGTEYRSNGYSIRPFKDIPVVPDSSWTRVYPYGTNYGIFHNTTLGLVSLSTNGTTWYTLADKNVGATVVYDALDAHTDANCGKLFQWGNNYGFTGPDNSGGISPTSSTQVNTSAYGPRNYYSSSTFIVSNPGDTDNEDWSTTRNSNLRGGDTGMQYIRNVISASDVVMSGDSGVTYTIRVSNSAPSGASNTTITLVP